MPFRSILLPTDLSDEARRPYAGVAEIARQCGARVELLHVVEDFAVGPSGHPEAPARHVPGTTDEMKRSRVALEGELGKLGSGLEVTAQVISAPSAPRAIADHARRHGFDLIAISTHGRGGFRRLIMGSVAEALLRHSVVPVLVFPRPE